MLQLGDNTLQVLYCGELVPDRCRELTGDPVGRNADWLRDVFEGVLNDGSLVTLAEQEADGGLVPFRAHRAVDRRQVEVELAGILRLELTDLELEDEVAVEADMVEEQVKVEGLLLR